MKLLVQSAMIFFGTLMAAGLLALGEPGRAASSVRIDVPPPPARTADALDRDWRDELVTAAHAGR